MSLGGSACFAGYESGSTQAAVPDCEPLAEFFAQKVWKPVMSTTCINCHVGGGMAAGTHFVLQSGTGDAALAANLEAAKKIAQMNGPGEKSLLLLKPSEQVPHGGGMIFSVDSSPYRAFADFAARVRGEDPTCGVN